jgi:hypothetical protein
LVEARTQISWATVWPLSHAGVVINSVGLFKDNDQTIFPLLVSLCIGLQLIYWGFVWWQWSPDMSTLPSHAVDSIAYQDVEAQINSSDHTDDHADDREQRSLLTNERDLDVSEQHLPSEDGIALVPLSQRDAECISDEIT